MALYAFGSVVIVSLISLIGVFTLSFNEQRLRRGIFLLVALAAGALLGDAFLHLIPESLNSPFASLLIIAGMLSFFILEKFLNWHHHGGHDESEHTHTPIKPIGKLVLVSDGLHNIIDGVIIGASFAISVPVGIASTIAIALHEIPQEIGDFGVLLLAGYSKSKALFLNFVSALFAIVGVILVIIVGEIAEDLVTFIIPFAAGSFIYIAAADLVPELHKRIGPKSALLEIIAISIGVGAMYLLLFLE